MQHALFDTRIALEYCRDARGDKLEIAFVEMAGSEQTGRRYAGMITEKDLFDLLKAKGIILEQVLEQGTGNLNVPDWRKRRR